MIKIDVDTFNLKYTLECGQCFRWEKEEDNNYIGVIKDRVINIKQDGNILYVDSNNKDDLELIIKEYFDLNTNYKSIEEEISKLDEHVKKSVHNSTGLRILKQDLFETIISFIISANNNIPRITKAINDISKEFGTKLTYNNKDYYLFPTREQLLNASVEDLQNLKIGYRAKYIYDTVRKLEDLDLNIDVDTNILKQDLLTLTGVGDKVADCILLFACKKYEAFPIDVWVKRVMSNLYLNEYDEEEIKKIKLSTIKDLSKRYGKYAGIVQEHLFYNIREDLL